MKLLVVAKITRENLKKSITKNETKRDTFYLQSVQ